MLAWGRCPHPPNLISKEPSSFARLGGSETRPYMAIASLSARANPGNCLISCFRLLSG